MSRRHSWIAARTSRVVIQDDEAMLAALRLAALKFDGKVSVNGDKQFRKRTFEIAQDMDWECSGGCGFGGKWRARQPKATFKGRNSINHRPKIRFATGERATRNRRSW